MKNVSLLLILVLAVLMPSGISRAGVAYPDPPGGWLYTYTGNSASAGTGGYTALDGTWSHDNESDEWDGTIIGAGRPGGANALGEAATNFLRLQDTGDPCNYGMYDPGSNRKIMFGHSITSDIGSSGDKILDDGITISFRARISTTTPPLDDLYEDGGGGPLPWPAGGDGYVLHHGGKSNFSVRQSNGNGIISFALVLQGEDHSAVAIPYSGLVMNDLNGTLPTSDVDQQDNDGGTLNLLSLNPTNWHEFWITIESDPGMTGTHLVNIYMDGSLMPAGFNVTAGNGADYTDSYIAMGVGSTAQSGALDIDFFSYKSGVHSPIDMKVPKHLKWSQPPIEIEPLSEPPVYCGWNEPSRIGARGRLYGIRDNFDGTYVIDIVTGVPTLIGPSAVTAATCGLAHSGGSVLYGSIYSKMSVIQTDGSGAVTMGEQGMEGMAYDQGTGTLYAVLNESFFTVDTATGNMLTDLGRWPNDPEGLAFDASVGAQGSVYGITTYGITPMAPGLLQRYDVATGNITTVGDTLLGTASNNSGLAYAPDLDVLFHITKSTGDLYMIDKNTAVATWIANTGIAGDDGFSGLAYGPGPGIDYAKVVADDFRCLGAMPLKSVHWWGSYLYWDGREPPLQAPSAWRIGFWSDVPTPVWSPGKLVYDPERVGPVAGGWGVLEVVDNGNMTNVVDAVASLESNTGTRYAYKLFGPININDPSVSAGNFPGDGPYGVVAAAIKPAGGVDDIAFLARGRVNIPTTGDWSFYIRSDDGELLSVDNGALVIGTEAWYDNNFGTVNLTAGEHDIQVIHREDGGGANVEVAAAKGATNNLYFFRLIGSGDPGLPATTSSVPGLVFDPTFTQSRPGASGAINNLAQAQAAITAGPNVSITDDRVNHSDPDNRGLGNEVFAADHDNPWDIVTGSGTDDDDSAILVEGEIWIATGGTYYIGYNSDDGAQLRIDTMGVFPWLSIKENVTGSAVLTTTLFPNDTLRTDTTTGKSWTVGEIFLPPGGYPFELLMFDRNRGFFVEMFGGTIPGEYDLLLTGPERYIPVPEVAPALELVDGPAPSDPDYSYPRELIWDIEVPADRVQQEYVGDDQFPDMPFESCFQYYVDLEPHEWFLQNPYMQVQGPEPLAYYKLDGDATDSSGNGHNGTEYGSPGYVAGVIGQAIDLDGISDYVDTGYTTDLPKWTIAAWVTSPAAPAAAAPSGPVHREKNYQINWNHVDPVFRGAAGVEVGGTWYAASFGTLNANTWYHLAATYDGNVLRAYKDGNLITSNPAPSGNPTPETASLKLGRHALSPQFFAGSFDEVRIYNRALSKEQIKTQMIGLVAHYELDETGGLTARDSSCHGNHGTLSDGPTWQPTGGMLGGALLFDGIDDQVDCGNVGIGGNAARTIGAWAKASSLTIPEWSTVFGFSNAGSGTATYFDIELDNLGNYVLHTYGWDPVLCPADLNWHHFAATHDGITTSWYLDGGLVGSAPATLSTVDGVRMGVRPMNDHYFPGLIDDAAIFNSALNSTQIQTMSLGASSFIGNPSLVALWELNESSGYTASDSSGNGNHGMLNDPPVWQPLGGQIKGALDFDGKDDFVDNGKTASQLGISGNAPRTVTAWVFTRSFNDGGIYELGQGGTDGYDFSLRTKLTDDHWRVQYWGSAFDVDFSYTSKNRWVHFAHVHDGSTTRVYADGQEVVNAPRTLNTADDKTFKIGKWVCGPAANPQWAAFFDGLIDDVRVYKRAMSADEIKSLSGTGEDIYWLSIAAVYPDDVGDIQNPWGFKTRPESWMDDAVRFELFEEPFVGTVTDPYEVTPIKDPRTQESFDLAFELDTDPDYIKWEQPFTGIRRWPHYEDERSKAITDPVQETFSIERLVADDWRCDRQTPVTAAVWWGSYIGYEYYACQEQQLPDPVKPDYFLLSIWTDVPAGADPDPQVPFSHPGKKIWQYTAYDYDEVMVGFDKHPHSVGTQSSSPVIHSTNTSTEVEVGPEFNISESIVTAQYVGEPALPPASVIAAATMAFPSASSTVVGSYPFMNATEIGGFWSVARGDSVTETFPTSEPYVKRAIFDFVVPTNVLSGGNSVHWDVLINGVLIGSFTVVQGQTGPVHLDFSFAPITGPNYTIRFEVTNEVPSFQGSHSLGYAGIHAGNVQLLGDTAKEPVFRYSVRLPKHAWFMQEDVNNIYWFSVVAVYNAGTDPQYDWGWTNHPHFFNDDAVAGTFDPEVGWSWEELYDQVEISEDMSFLLFTEPECLDRTAPEYSDWSAWGKPDCWCYSRQCRGDINGLKHGPFWVQVLDLNLFKAAFNKTDVQLPPGGICADLNHVKHGPFRVQVLDLDIFKIYFNKIETLVPECNQLPIYTGPYNYWTKP
jgi:hypothetical protein